MRTPPAVRPTVDTLPRAIHNAGVLVQQAAVEVKRATADSVVRPADVINPSLILVLVCLSGARVDVDVATVAAVRQLRDAGASWQVIADALGVTRQAAHKRFLTEDDLGRRTPAPPGTEDATTSR